MIRHRKRHTLAAPLEFTGKGVHSGQLCHMVINPAPPGSGIAFRRIDLPGAPVIPASYDYLAAEELDRRTTLRLGNAAVHTVEHVLSALSAAGIDDALIEQDAAEPPFIDGSSLPFASAIQKIGPKEHGDAISPVVITQPMAFALGGAEICAIPSNTFRVTFFYTSSHPSLRSQSYSAEITPESYLKEIAPARTFCFFDEIEAMRKADLIKGANLSSAVVIGRKALINDSMRFPDEPVRHKILDFIGDMALLGAPLQGHFMAWRAGHRVNAAFGQYLKKELNF